MKHVNKEVKIQLDNAAKIYPAAMTKKHNSVYRVSAFMKETVNVIYLKQAVADLAPRFPTLYVQLKKGFLWNYFEKVTNYDIVEKESNMPCRPMNVGTDDKPMFRVLYKDKCISVEFFHALTDGTGATVYLKTLLGRYLELNGHYIEKSNGVLDLNDSPEDNETEDSFLSLYKKGYGASRKEKNAYQYKTSDTDNFLQTISGTLPINELKCLTKQKYKCTITEYLVGTYAYSFLQQYLLENKDKSSCKPIKISVPINLRPYFDSQTLRNFASFVNVEINPCESTLEEVINTVKTQMDQMITKEKLHKTVSQNVSDEMMFISKYSPMFIKKHVMKICFKLYGERKCTSTLSNIGLLKLPSSMKAHVEKFDFILGTGTVNTIMCGVIGFENNLTVTFSSTIRDTKIQDCFFNTISSDAINVSTVYRDNSKKSA